MKGLHLSEKELAALLQEGQHAVLYEIPLSLNIEPSVRKAKQPDTELTKALKKATRNKLQEAFLNTWVLCGGSRDYWTPEYKFHETKRWRFDFANPDDRIAVECNGGQWQQSGHSSGKGLQRDAEKLNAAASLGWRVYVLTTSMLSKREAIGNVQKILQEVKGERAFDSI